jgi:hypothetical protein
MSAPRYVITLSVPGTGHKISRKLKTIVGDHDGLAAELRHASNEDFWFWRNLSEDLVQKAGGRDKIVDEWQEHYRKLIESTKDEVVR